MAVTLSAIHLRLGVPRRTLTPQTDRGLGVTGAALTTPSSVTLTGVPVELFWTLAEHSESLLREYALRGLGDSTQPYDADAIARAGHAIAALNAAVTSAVTAATGQPGSDRVDAQVELALVTPGDFGLLQGVLDDAAVLAATGELLAFPPLPEIRALRDWLCEETFSQSAGAGGRRWELPLETRPLVQTPLAEWRELAALPTGGSWIVGDDHNRIIGASDAVLALLGWTAEDLVGQRIIAIIPPRLRERHLVAFTRGLLSGVNTLLEQPLPLFALHRAGHEIPITLVLTKHSTHTGRTVYLAELTTQEV
jgi:PAS domain S-box-containing protein